jgi:hypothetical protein
VNTADPEPRNRAFLARLSAVGLSATVLVMIGLAGAQEPALTVAALAVTGLYAVVILRRGRVTGRSHTPVPIHSGPPIAGMRTARFHARDTTMSLARGRGARALEHQVSRVISRESVSRAQDNVLSDRGGHADIREYRGRESWLGRSTREGVRPDSGHGNGGDQ